MATTPNKSLMALDVGQARIGVAICTLSSRLPHPLDTLQNDTNILKTLVKLINDENIVEVVIGLPRGLSGQETDQTNQVRLFAQKLGKVIDVPIHLQDEALTSKKAEAELAERNIRYNKGAIDALAATYILDDFLVQRQEAK